VSASAWLGVSVAICVALWLLVLGFLFAFGRRDRARELLTLIPDCVVLGRRLLADPGVPRRAKIVLGLLVAYLVSPIDLIPDFVPGLGLLDDAIVAAAALRYVTRIAGPETVDRHWPGGRVAPSALTS
jgi:uncharacterized membrane protein YkvA (DUF1232 family)